MISGQAIFLPSFPPRRKFHIIAPSPSPLGWEGGGTRERYRGCTGGDSDKALGNCCNLGFFVITLLCDEMSFKYTVFFENSRNRNILKIAIGKYKVQCCFLKRYLKILDVRQIYIINSIVSLHKKLKNEFVLKSI